MMRIRYLLLFLFSVSVHAGAQDSQFNVVLNLNTESAAATVGLYEGLSGNPEQIAQLRGSQIALAATAMLNHGSMDTGMLEKSLAAVKYNQDPGNDLFRMRQARANVAAIKELLVEIGRRNFDRKVVWTVEQLFPLATRIHVSIPVYFLAFGPQNVDAFVQRIVWRGNTPVFVPEGEGELSIVVNLAASVYYGNDVNERFVGLMSNVAHEVFHAAFGAYKDSSPFWRSYYATSREPLDGLLDLAQNEGIAYYLTLIQRTQGKLPPGGTENVQASFRQFNTYAAELLSGQVSARRAHDIIQMSNTSGFWQNYGAITGMIVARQIDQSLGRSALMETIARGPADFFGKYITLMRGDNSLPPLSDAVVRFLGTAR